MDDEGGGCGCFGEETTGDDASTSNYLMLTLWIKYWSWPLYLPLFFKKMFFFLICCHFNH